MAAWTSMMLVVVLWVWGQGVRQLGTVAGLLNSVGRLTGLVSADLLLIQVLLISRIPWVERSFGQDELVRRHRLVGFTSFSLMVGHIVLITLAYAASDQIGVLAEVWSLVTTYPGMLLATAGTALLVMVVVTSVRAVRRRLRYESWHLLHLYAYLGVGLALPHQLWTGSDFIDSPIASAYWWTVYLAAAGAVLVFRVGLPIWRNWTHRLVVDRVVPEGRGVVSIYLRGRNLHRLRAEAGQFFVWRFMHGAGWTRGNPFSLSAAPNGRLLRITAKDLGTGSRRLAKVPVGTRVVFEGPFGRLTDSVRRMRKMTMIASGIGITPLRALLEEADYRPGQAVLLYRASAPPGLLFRRELDALAVHRGVRVVYLPGPRMRDRRSWLPRHYAVTADGNALRNIVPDIKEHDVFICGPDGWTEAVIASVRRAGVPAEQVHTERFAW
ncbi:ferredoxin reductase family protein [Pseudonocardia aurantiaca]|uniref:Ferredoxin reductase family protein n=1 Tax=Pseudonocardia aurantiaca TaxID=75290 RepID=A0ABW4FJR3_9PSEU